ncbi:MAG: hypothetical protein MUE92_12685 [Chloroflexi bacterium]|nr:hypothetical protein [Chloroflexota bacterium]
MSAPGLSTPPRDLRFSSRQILDLQLRARLRQNLQGDHLLRLKVFTPGGFLYQEIAVPFVAAATPDREARRARARSGAAARATSLPPPAPRAVAGYPRPLEVQRLVPVRGDAASPVQYEVASRLPVAGTSITTSSLFGRWSVEPYLDGQATPCGPAVRFTIQE